MGSHCFYTREAAEKKKKLYHLQYTQLAYPQPSPRLGGGFARISSCLPKTKHGCKEKASGEIPKILKPRSINMNRRAAKFQEKQRDGNGPKTQAARFDTRPRATKLGNDFIPFHNEYTFSPTKVVDLFLENFKFILASEGLADMIQLVKGELFNRDYLSAFDNDDKRFAYAARWTPSRALAYSSLFASLEPIAKIFQDPDRKNRVLCVGGGAASELVGMSSLFCSLKQPNGGSASELVMDVIDIADWSTIVTNITSFIQKNWLYDSSKLSSNFIHGDILMKTPSELELSQLDLITLLFTTNELFCEKKTETIKFLQAMSAHCRKGALLLITESAGSYSHITIGLKKFPVQFLIDTILVGKPGSDTGAWELVEQSESCWYRMDERAINYPVKLENMRFFYRLYQKK